MTDPLRFAVGSDTRHPTADAVVAHLQALGHTVTRIGAVGTDDPLGWAEVGEQVAEQVADGRVDGGVVCCWTGTGVSIAANKIPGVRCALCTDAATARGARRWNDANVLALGLAGTDADSARTIVDAWLDVTSPDDEETSNIEHVSSIERRHMEEPAPQ